MKAIWNNTVLAESNDTIVIEGNHYFPPSALNMDYFTENSSKTVCPWKGEASYFDVVVDGETNKASAWVYNEPKKMAENIKGYVAFWKGIKVV